MFHSKIARLFEKSSPRKRARQAPMSKRLARPLQMEFLEDRMVLSHILGTAESFAVLGGQTVTNTGPTVIFGDLGVSPGTAITGFPPGMVSGGAIHAADAVALQAQSDVTIAYNDLAGRASNFNLTGQDLGGLTLIPGVYTFSTSAQLTGTLTLDAQGNPDAEFIFQIGSTLITASNSSVAMINGGDPCEVYWQVGSSATIGTTTVFVGNILALTSIALQTGATVDGRALARNGEVTLDTNTVSIEHCFADSTFGSISGSKFNDLNGNGIQEAGDPALSGLTVFIDANMNGMLDPGELSTTTDVDGNYSFTDLEPGTYRVRQSLETGIVQTTDNPPDITIVGGDDVTDVDFGDFLLVSIGGTKFLDSSNDGVFDPGEPGLQGWTVYIDANGSGMLDPGEVSTTTDGNGNYTFTGLGPGAYIIREVGQPGFTQTTVDPAGITVSSGTDVSGVIFGNFGEFQPISISGTKFQDTDGDGVVDPGEPGLAGFVIYLDANDNGMLDPGEVSTTTDADGNYSFTGLSPGTYFVREVGQPGFTQTTVDPPGITVSSGQDISGVIFANFELVSIGGTKIEDIDGDGVVDPGEPGLPGFVIYIDADNNGMLDPGEVSTTTGINGNYTFMGLGPGTYIIREVGQPGFTQTTLNPAGITVSSGQDTSGVIFANFELISISGTKFQDSNGTGVRDTGEPGLQGWTIFLDANDNGVFNPGEVSTTTDVNGNFAFTGLAPGTYIVREVGQLNFVQMTNNPADIVAASGVNRPGILFGNIPVNNLVTVTKLLLTGQNLSNFLDGTFARQANFVANLYQTILGRAPDIDGLTYYLRLLAAGFSETQVAGLFAAGVPRTTLDSTDVLVVASGPGAQPRVQLYDRNTGQLLIDFLAYGTGFRGGVNVAIADVNGDGTVDVITAPGPGGGPHIRVFDGVTGNVLQEFFAYDSNFTGGVFVATGDFNADGKADIVTGAGAAGGPHVRIFNSTGGMLGEYFAYDPSFTGGVHVAVGDVDGNGTPDVITGPGAGGGPHVRVFSGATSTPIQEYFAYDPLFTGGVWVAAGDVDGDGRDDVITGAGAGGGPHVKVFSGANGQELKGFFAYDVSFTGGVRVGTGDFDGDGRADIITGAGAGGGPLVRTWDGDTLGLLTSFFAFVPSFSGGVFVAAPADFAGQPLQASSAGSGGAALSQGELDLIVAAAISRWEATTLGHSTNLRAINVQFADLPGNYLALAYSDLLLIDDDAAGHGWFLDSTPLTDEEFTLGDRGLLAALAGTAAEQHIDLLTVLSHEFGHVLGLDDLGLPGGTDLMSDQLATGQRRTIGHP